MQGNAFFIFYLAVGLTLDKEGKENNRGERHEGGRIVDCRSWRDERNFGARVLVGMSWKDVGKK